jgi:N-acetylglucosamine kinase-like BadF-type ATPase
MKCYLGLDVGGTKTFCLIGDDQGNIEGFGCAGTGNYEYYGIEAAAAENRKAVEGALADARLSLGDIAGIGMGVAGADLPEDYGMLEREIYTPLFGSIRRIFRNDSMAGLRGGTREPYGIVIVCGTGSVCAGRNRAGHETRVGGMGEEFGDQCSGSGLGREGLHAVWRARDGITPPTLLTEKLVEQGRCRDVDELFYKLYRGQMTYSDLEPMAKPVFDAAFEGDATACDILERGGRYLGTMVNAVARKLDMTRDEFEIVQTGSVFKGNSPVLKDAMRTVIHQVCPQARSVMPAFEPVVGALLMGMELDMEISEAVYQNLSRQLAAAEERYKVQLRGQ